MTLSPAYSYEPLVIHQAGLIVVSIPGPVQAADCRMLPDGSLAWVVVGLWPIPESLAGLRVLAAEFSAMTILDTYSPDDVWDVMLQAITAAGTGSADGPTGRLDMAQAAAGAPLAVALDVPATGWPLPGGEELRVCLRPVGHAPQAITLAALSLLWEFGK